MASGLSFELHGRGRMIGSRLVFGSLFTFMNHSVWVAMFISPHVTAQSQPFKLAVKCEENSRCSSAIRSIASPKENVSPRSRHES